MPIFLVLLLSLESSVSPAAGAPAVTESLLLLTSLLFVGIPAAAIPAVTGVPLAVDVPTFACFFAVAGTYYCSGTPVAC